jgi:hypothetical protein
MRTGLNNLNKILTTFTASLSLVFSSVPAAGQTGHWKSYLSYYNTAIVVETPRKVFAVATPHLNSGPDVNAAALGSLYSYSLDDQEVKTYSKADGLNDIHITHIAYSESEDALLIVYANANIDLLTASGIYNFPSIKEQSISNKTISDVTIYGKYAYLSTTFGIVAIDMQKKEIPGTYDLGSSIYSVCVKDGYLYASTSGGMFYISLSKDLGYINNWQSYNPGIDGLDVNNVRKILAFQDALVFSQHSYGIFYERGGEKGNLSWEVFKKVTIAGNQLVGIRDTSVFFWSDLGSDTKTVNLRIADISARKQNIFWLAQGEQGLGSIRKEAASGEYSVYQPNIVINSPRRNFSYSITFQQNKLLVTGGYAVANRANIPGTLMVLENGDWYNFDENKITQAVREQHKDTIPYYSCRDFMNAIVDPRDPNHYFVSSFGEGLYEFRNNEFVSLYNASNSTLHPVIDPPASNFIRIGGLAYDKNNNLYAGMAVEESVGGNSPYALLMNNGKWAPTYSEYVKNLYFTPVNEVFTTSKGQLWVGSSRCNIIYVFENNGTPDNFYDDKHKLISGSVKDQKGETFTFSRCSGITEDQRGTVWVGTSQGPILFYNPEKAVNDPDNFYCTRPILPNNDGTDEGHYLLELEQINTIAVDGANRKWLGTQLSGAYLLSETGMEILEHFTVENSPLISNTINKIAINPQTGEVFIATDQGLVSYMGNATEGKSSYKEARVYPNPVRPEFDNLVTVTNLIKDSNVRITDMRGNLIYQGLSKGGMFTWNCTNRSGERVKTGVYLVFAATPDGGEGVVTKITVIK